MYISDCKEECKHQLNQFHMRVFEHSAMDQDTMILEFQDSKILMTGLVFLLSCDLKTQPEKIGIFIGCCKKQSNSLKSTFYENDATGKS